MSRDSNRLLLELEKYRREINRETVNPALATAEVDTLVPVVKVCAQARAKYIECLMSIANGAEKSGDDESGPSSKQIDQLKQFRIAYEELVCAANALETVIERGYVDVKES